MTNLEQVNGELANSSQNTFVFTDPSAAICEKLDKIIELLEVQVGALITAQEEADQPEEVDRGYLDG